MRQLDFIDAYPIANAAAARFELVTEWAYVTHRTGWLSGEPLFDVGVVDADGYWHTATVLGDVYDAAWSAVGIIEDAHASGTAAFELGTHMLVRDFADLLLSYGDFGDDE